MYCLAREVSEVERGSCGHAEPNSVACIRVVCTYFSYFPPRHSFIPLIIFTVARWYYF